MAAFFLTTLGGCAVVDQYGSRAIDYNEQTATSKSSTILLNILRAAYHEPLQFTDVSTVTGLASAQAGINASIPFRIGGANFTAPNILTLTPSGSVSGGPNFSVANLNTKEFYQGLQTPIQGQIIKNYAAAGISRWVLVPLFISEIELDTHDKTYVQQNGASRMFYQDFLQTTKSLIERGVDVEDRDKPGEFVGPSLSSEQASDPKLLSGLAQAMATGGSSSSGGSSSTSGSSSSGGSSLSLKEVKTPADKGSPEARYRLSKPGGKSPRFCINPKIKYLQKAAYHFPRKQGITTVRVPFPEGNGSVTAQACYCDAGTNGKSSGPKCSIANEGLKVTVRSLEQVFLFLGEIVRTELDQGPAVLENPHGNPAKGIPTYLFRVEQRLPSNGEISANFHGLPYTISADLSGADASSQVVQLVTDLLALESSAKDLPPSNVIAISP